MTEIEITRAMLRRAMRGIPAKSTLAKTLLNWARQERNHVFGAEAEQPAKMTWSELKAASHHDNAHSGHTAPVIKLAEELAALMRLDEEDTAVLRILIGFKRLPRPSNLLFDLSRHIRNLPAFLGEVAGIDTEYAERRVRRHPLVRSGLFGFKTDGSGRTEISMRWTLDRLLDAAPDTTEEILRMLVGPVQTTTLTCEDFAHVADTDFLMRLLAGARREEASGVNILLYGPPGTGKTAFARTIAQAVGLSLHGAGEYRDDGDEPDRFDRITALQLGQRLLARNTDSALLFDEMEDLIGDAKPSAGDWMTGRDGSKLFVNRMLEDNPVPVIWTTNAVGNLDPAILRRMSFTLEMKHPSRATAQRILARVASEEGVVPAEGFEALLENTPEAASVLRGACRAAKLAGAEDGGLHVAKALARTLSGREVSADAARPIDLALYETDLAIAPLFEAIEQGSDRDISLLLTGPPGTGKTELAHHLARQLDRPLLVKRTSDLLSKWVGQTEAQIADAFVEARERDAVLLFDEVDSLLFDRSNAKAQWEVSQVNELLTWLDKHPLPVVAATNHAAKLDPATMRRFTFKLELRALEPANSAAAFERFFDRAPPPCLRDVTGLTPGDFALVAKQLRHAPAANAEDIVGRLRREADAKPGTSGRMGF